MKFNFKRALENAKTEEAVKAAYVKQFNLNFNNPVHADLYSPPVLFEFKYDVHLRNAYTQAKVLAQALYYVRRIHFDAINVPAPYSICLADKNEVVLLYVEPYLSILSENFDWKRAPSSPDPKLIIALTDKISAVYYDLSLSMEDMIVDLQSRLDSKSTSIKRLITVSNYESVYKHWQEEVGIYIPKEKQPIVFVQDACEKGVFSEKTGELVLSATMEKFQVMPKNYIRFWDNYTRPPTVAVQDVLMASIDRLHTMNKRRFEGIFHTPELFAKKAVEYLREVYGENFEDEYYIYDNCCGMGNLEIPLKRYDRLFMSTLDGDEVKYLIDENIFPGATIFQFDFLNDPIEKMPARLREIAEKESSKLIILMNPPYAEATGGCLGQEHKEGVSKNTEVIKDFDLGVAGNELFIQFLVKAQDIFEFSKVAFFSKLKYLVAPNFQKFRDEYIGHVEKGFIFHCKVFNGTKGNWPVAFSILFPTGHFKSKYRFDILNELGDKIGDKWLAEPKTLLNNWIDRPKCDMGACPLSSAIQVQIEARTRLEKINVGATGYAVLPGNDIQQENIVCFMSSAFSNGNGLSITPDNFEKAMISVAVRKVITPTWLNDRDQFQIPTTDVLSIPEFVTDCVIYNLFAGHNQTSSFTAECKGKTYFIDNQFYPFSMELAKAGPQERAFQKGIDKNTFVHEWLQKNMSGVSELGRNVLNKGEAIYKVFYREWKNIRKDKWKIENWKPGWYQIRNALMEADLGTQELAELKVELNRLKEKLREKVYEYGFLPKEVIYTDDAKN